MIPRFYDPTAGTITFNHIDLRAVTKKELRDRIALVSQTPVLFNATLADNIRAGRLGASDAEVQAAAERAHLGAFIATLPQGLQTPMGERGSSLSGGQRQRVAIARAFLKDAPILILDEATSALDSESEASIQAALQELAKGRTTLMIAHRFSSIRHATRILVFEDGRIVGDGPHTELYATSPLYRNLYDQQTPAHTT
jgi:subfamily B ATP-binding cassette protein MsbA